MITTNAIISKPIGAFVNVPLPISNDRFSIQLELIKHRIHYSQEFTSPYVSGIELNTTLVSAPLSLKYEITREKLTPSISFDTEAKFVKMMDGEENSVMVPDGLEKLGLIIKAIKNYQCLQT